MTSPHDLNPKARALLDAGRAALRATAGDRERIEAALRARLGPDALPVEADVPSVSTPTAWRAVARLAIGVGVVVGATFVALRPITMTSLQSPVQHAPSPPVAAPQEVGTPADVIEPAPIVVTADNAPSVTKGSAPSTARRPDGLAQEVALLSRAATQLRSGQAAKALKVLDEHERRFPRGSLREERRAARAQAFCLLGQVDKARAELALLPAQSPAAARALQVCDAERAAQPSR
jgi:hypothetical protein